VFSGLFLVVGLVLWIRGSDPARSNFPATTEIVKESPVETVDASVDNNSKTGKSPVSSNASTQIISDTKAPSESTQEITQNQKKPLKPESRYQPVPIRRIASKPLPRKRSQQSTQDSDWEDRIFAAIDASFDWIEDFFEEYATPIAVSTNTLKQPKKVEQPEIAFPAVRFNSGTAELTIDSQVELKILATRLTTEYPRSVLEIQAYVDSIGPEAFNFVLTQARADAVRDLLIAEGMKESRIIAKGYGTGEDPELADSKIEFIVKR